MKRKEYAVVSGKEKHDILPSGFFVLFCLLISKGEIETLMREKLILTTASYRTPAED